MSELSNWLEKDETRQGLGLAIFGAYPQGALEQEAMLTGQAAIAAQAPSPFARWFGGNVALLLAAVVLIGGIGYLAGKK